MRRLEVVVLMFVAHQPCCRSRQMYRAPLARPIMLLDSSMTGIFLLVRQKYQ